MAWKIKAWFLRLGEYFMELPFRLVRFLKWLCWIDHPHGHHQLARWTIGLFLKVIDLTPVPWIIEIFLDLVKWNTRGLNANEKRVIHDFFQGAINPELIGLDSKSWFVKKGRASAFVTLHTINFYGTITDASLIHESVHIWQYRHHGSLYISEALYAQHWGGGYNYGGTAELTRSKDKGLNAFNFEQQADLIEDAYRLAIGMPLQWCDPGPEAKQLLTFYRSFLV